MKNPQILSIFAGLLNDMPDMPVFFEKRTP